MAGRPFIVLIAKNKNRRVRKEPTRIDKPYRAFLLGLG